MLNGKKRTSNMKILTEKQCNTCHQVKDIERFTIQKKKGINAHYKGKCKDCYVHYRKQQKELGSKEGVRKPKVEQYWKHISWL
jgi:hypothetical protein